MENLQLSYEMGGSGNYLSASLAEEVNTYQLKMIENNKITGILPIHSLMMNGQYKLQYDITGKSRLIDFLNKEGCTGDRARKLLHSLVYAMVHAEDYLLTYKQFLLEKEYIYIDSQYEVSFVYLPLSKRVATTAEENQIFIKNLLLEYCTADGDAFFLGLLRYVSMSEYSLIGLLEKLEGSQPKEPAHATPKESVAAPCMPEAKKESAAVGSQIKDILPKGKKEPESEAKKEKAEEANAVADYGFAIPGMPMAAVPVKNKEEKGKEKQKEKKPSFFDSFKSGGKSKEKPIKEEMFTGAEKDFNKSAKKKQDNEEVWKGTQIGYGMQEDTRTVCLSDDVAVEAAYIKHGEKRISMEHFPFYIGREEADYVLPRPKVSRKHAYIAKKGEQYFIFDENSTNHTYVNGKVIAPYTETELVSGDTIRLADENITFLIEN